MARKEIQVFSISFLDVLSGALGAVLLLYIIVPRLNISEEEFEEQAKLAETVKELGLQIQDIRTVVPGEIFDNLQNQMATLEEARQALEQQISRLQVELRQSRQATAEAQQVASQLKTEVSVLQAQALQSASHAQSEISDLERQIQQYQEELEKLEGEGRFILVTLSWPTELHDVDLHIMSPWGDEFYFNKKTYPGQPGELTLDNKNGPGLEVWAIKQPPVGTYEVYAKLFDRKGNSENAPVSVTVYHRNGVKAFQSVVLSRSGGSFTENKKLIGTILVPESGVLSIQ